MKKRTQRKPERPATDECHTNGDFDRAIVKLSEISSMLDLIGHQPLDADGLHKHTLQTLAIMMEGMVREAHDLLVPGSGSRRDQ